MIAQKPSSFHRRLIDALRGWSRRMMNRSRARTDMRQLAGMSDHELRDLGIGRSEVPELLDRHRY